MEYLLLITGFVLLLFSGKFLVKGSVALANYFKVSKLVIGVTVVSFGTSVPELFVSTIANYTGHPEVALGNVIGSNIANIALVLAITAMIFPVYVRKDSVKIDAPFMLIVSGLLYVLMLNGVINRGEGAGFLIILTAYILFIVFRSRKNDSIIENKDEKSIQIRTAIFLVLIASVGLAVGSKLLIVNASTIALNFGLSERVIAITIIAFGTSLPELATSAIAAFRKEMDISIGNIIGSNIFNILAVLGITASIKPIHVAGKFIYVDIFWMLAISVLLFLFILPFKGGKLTRVKGFLLFGVYCVYIYFLFK